MRDHPAAEHAPGWRADLLAGVGMEEDPLVKVSFRQHLLLIHSVQGFAREEREGICIAYKMNQKFEERRGKKRFVNGSTSLTRC